MKAVGVCINGSFLLVSKLTAADGTECLEIRVKKLKKSIRYDGHDFVRLEGIREEQPS